MFWVLVARRRYGGPDDREQIASFSELDYAHEYVHHSYDNGSTSSARPFLRQSLLQNSLGDGVSHYPGWSRSETDHNDVSIHGPFNGSGEGFNDLPMNPVITWAITPTVGTPNEGLHRYNVRFSDSSIERAMNIRYSQNISVSQSLGNWTLGDVQEIEVAPPDTDPGFDD